MIKAKIMNIGNSLGFILPKEAINKLHVKKGDVVYLCDSPDGFTISAHDLEFVKQMQIAESLMHENGNILKALSKL